MIGLRDRLSALRSQPERGAFAVFVVGMALALFVIAGLVIDGGNALNARQRILDDVEQAARAGAAEIDVAHLRATGVVQLDTAAAEARARGYLVGLGYAAGDVGADADAGTITVVAEDEEPTALLSLIGKQEMPVRGEATARAATGIDAEDP